MDLAAIGDKSRMSSQMRGLNVFISDIRACRSREEEEKRVNKEKANIRSKFKEGKLTSYDKKKYVCKILYMYILGWELDFGHVEAVNLISGNKFTEKQIGYLAVSLILTENAELIRIVVNSMKNDLQNHNEIFNCLALAAIANIGGREMSEALYTDVYRLLIGGGGSNPSPFVKKKAALCLLRLFRKSPESLPGADWGKSLINMMDDPDLGVVSCVVSLITALAQQFPNEFSGCIAKSIDKMDQLLQGNIRSDYEYYRLPSPWLQVKCLRLLQCYPSPDGQTQRNQMLSLCSRVINKAQENVKPGNFANALNAVVFEGINLAIQLDPEAEVVKKAIGLLGSFISHKETNFRYLGLETMANLALVIDSLEPIKRHTDAVLQTLRDKDISVRRRGLDLLYCMCDSGNSRRIVRELLQYLGIADFNIREELVLKIAILAERFATDYAWYVDVVLQLISNAGDHVPEDVWYRVIQIVINNPDLQQYATATVFAFLKNSAWHETAVKVAGYILGEFGDLIANEAGSAPIDQFMALHSKFALCSSPTKSLLFTSYIKLVNLFPEIREEVIAVLRHYRDVLDSEMQQRACEYLAIIQSSNTALLESVCEEMPPFPDKEESPLVSLVQKNTDQATDKVLRMRPKSKHKERHNSLTGLAQRQIEASQQGGRRSSNASRSSLDLNAGGGRGSPAPGASSSSSSRTAAPPPSSGLDDLLGLGGTSSSSASASAPNDILGLFDPSASSGSSSASSAAGEPTPGSQKFFLKFLSASEGILWEDSHIQIGVKSEFKGPLGRVVLYYGNKLGSPLESFFTSLPSLPNLKVQPVPIPSPIPPKAQVQQMFQLECGGEFAQPPVLALSFSTPQGPVRLNLSFPVLVTKFMEPIQLGSDDFFGRWKQIGGPPKEVQRDFKAPVNIPAFKEFIVGMKFSCLEGIDPNPANLVCAGIFASNSGKVGCLLRVQTNASDQSVRVTARTTNPAVSEIITNLVVKRITTN